MQVTTILNRIEKHKGFVFGKAHFEKDGAGRDCIEVPVRARKRSRAVCSGCGRRGPTYDRLPERRFTYVPLWGIAVMLVYRMRRVNCLECGVTVESVPWAAGKSPITRSLALFLADWAKLLCWQDVARRFRVNWRQVFESVSYVVAWGLAHRNLSGVRALGQNSSTCGGHVTKRWDGARSMRRSRAVIPVSRLANRAQTELSTR